MRWIWSVNTWQIHEGLSSPVNVTWEITNRCNLSCIHCLSDSGPRQNDKLNLGQCRRVIDELAAEKVFQINFGGGEPFTREDFLPILEYCHSKGLVTCISTNGTLLNEKAIDFLSGRNLVYLQVSLDGATSETNDRIRGFGTYEKILRALERLRTKEIPCSVNMVLTRFNFPELSAVEALAKEYDAKLRVSRFRPSGRGKDSWSMLRLEKEELKSFSQWLSGHQEVVTGDSFFSIEEDARKGLGLNLCGAAKFTCCISPEGKVYPCAFLQDERFCGGYLLEQSLMKIWNQAPGFLLLRNLKIKSCETCVRYEACHGGCPAIAYFMGNELGIPDPECLIHCISKI